MKQVETSKEAFLDLNKDSVKALHYRMISALACLEESSFEGIAAYLRIDRDKIWRRINELLKEKHIYRTQNKVVLKSGRRGFTYRLTNPPKTDKEKKELIERFKHPPINLAHKNINLPKPKTLWD